MLQGRPELPAGARVPDASGVIFRGSDDLAPVRTEGRVENRVGMSAQLQAAVGAELGQELEGQRGRRVMLGLQSNAFREQAERFRLAAFVGQNYRVQIIGARLGHSRRLVVPGR